MDVTEDTVRDICTDAVFERGERYLAEGRIHEIHRVDSTVTAVVSGSRQYDVRVDLAADGFAPWCDCPYDRPGACKHVVAVLLRCVDDPPADDGDRLDAALDSADDDELRAFLRDELATNTDLRERFLAGVGEPTSQSVDELRASIDRRFHETNPEYHVVFEPIDFTQWFELANEYREQERHTSAATVYRALVESLDDNMERVDGAYDHFSRAFSQALDGYIDCVATANRDADAVTDAVAFLEERVTAGTPVPADHFEKAAVELRAKLGEQAEE
ncbi:SWIM zinc finger domain-containing protein [Halorubrum ezzemoulense]|uniref:SWIM zinc finger family protein n=1 Tax=Halorubrum ezzemoulense TaxID=337243 RepID=UPI00232D51D3|nr:SWIM zinc finger family protein [Halorubrum ezzemoulense]MDB2226286.1 SWIM zinc finger domain-containing protein [Halorubrum ezzemoulense]MDB2272235.1 SWIM zinc finger domain-containing protein [Halorubrum ezzemoulense]